MHPTNVSSSILAIYSLLALPHLTSAYPRDVPPECGGHPLTHVGLPCVTEMDCAPRGTCLVAPAVPKCSCYDCEHLPQGCTSAQRADCAVTPRWMWKLCTRNEDCVPGNTCMHTYIRVCTCPKPLPPGIGGGGQ